MTPEISELKRLVEEKLGKALSTTTDFDEFSGTLKREYGREVSTATLKRLWGYVRDEHKPRTNTLDSLAKYIERKNYKAYCEWLKTTDAYSSSFFRAQQVMSNSLKQGQEVTIGWSPNRTVRLRYLGENRYEVLESVNSKLQCGDQFTCSNFIMGYPLYLPCLIRGGEATDAFVAARGQGLTLLQIES